MTLTARHHVAIICSDYPRAKRFYTAGPGGAQIELFSFPDAPVRPTHPEARGLRHLAFAVADPAADIVELSARGIVVEPVRLDELTGRRFTFFADPDGLPIERYEQTSPG